MLRFYIKLEIKKRFIVVDWEIRIVTNEDKSTFKKICKKSILSNQGK